MKNFRRIRLIMPTGGQGKRMKPFTQERSKSLVPLFNHFPITEISLFNLCLELGFRHIIFGVHGYLNYLNVQAYYQGGRGWSAKLGLTPQVNFQYQNPYYQDLGSADSTLYNLKKFAINDPVFVISNDNLFSPIDLKKMWKVAQKSPLPFFIGLTQSENIKEYGRVILDKKTQRITQFMEKPNGKKKQSNLINTAVYLIKPAALKYLEKDFGQNTLPLLAKKKLLGGVEFSQPWYDFGSPRLHRASFLKILNQSFEILKPFLKKTCLKVKGKNVWIRGRDEYSGKISENLKNKICKGEIQTKGTVIIGRDCAIGKGVNLSDCSLGDLSTVEEGTIIKESNLMDAWQIGQEVTIKNSLLGRGGLIADFAKIKDSFLGDNVKIGSKANLNKAVVNNHELVKS